MEDFKQNLELEGSFRPVVLEFSQLMVTAFDVWCSFIFDELVTMLGHDVIMSWIDCLLPGSFFNSG